MSSHVVKTRNSTYEVDTEDMRFRQLEGSGAGAQFREWTDCQGIVISSEPSHGLVILHGGRRFETSPITEGHEELLMALAEDEDAKIVATVAGEDVGEGPGGVN